MNIMADVSMEAKDFNLRLLFKDPTQRIGYGKNGLYNIKSHCWFKNIDWDLAIRQEINPEFVPGEKITKRSPAEESLLTVCPLPIPDFDIYWKSLDQ